MMLAPQSDGNVLYGLLALQLGLVPQELLLSAMADWAADRSRSLGAILLDRGQIAPEVHALLEPLVLGHSSSRVGDAWGETAPEKPTAGYGWPRMEDTQGEVAPNGDPRPVAIPTASWPLSTTDLDRIASRFRILRPYNEGGLGVISVAQDEELGRQVALKEIKLRYADEPNSRARFMLEAEVTGKLEHPGIVPVYGLGTYPDGRPYYAMRLIRGDSLAEAIDRLHKGGKSGFDPVRRSLSSRQVMERFLDVCDAIEYAHSRGVIHRDLKPDNIMLGPYGETLVVDWGLARPMGQSLSDTGSGESPVRPSEAAMPPEVEGSPTGTPRYMSPEQVRGEIESIGAPTDVYGLGATLYHLLTGEPPLRGVQGGEVYRRVEQGKISPPRSVNRRVPRALDAICRKAMATRPEDRYPSARILAEDLRRWLADEPVSAHPEASTARLARWTRRNRSLVLALTVVLVFVALSSMIVAGIYREAARADRLATTAARISMHRAKMATQLVEESRERLIRGAALFAAETLTRELEQLGRVLELQAEDPRLQALLRQTIDDPAGNTAHAALQEWIDQVYDRNHQFVTASNWFITGRDGTQLARSPFDSDSIGKNFAYRDYIHGLGRDLDRDEATARLAAGTLPIIDGLHRTPIYQSVATGNPMVTFSAPIADPDAPGRTLGVLGISIEIGRFNVLSTSDGNNLVASLVDTRADQSPDGASRRGLILQHPWLAQFPDNPPRLYHPVTHLAEFDRLRRESSMGALKVGTDEHYRDPVGFQAEGDSTRSRYDGTWVAAFVPIIARRSDGIGDTGWFVIVQGRTLSDAVADDVEK